MRKKGQGISMNVIIIAAIALLVLVVLSIIFMGRMGQWGADVDSCVTKGGTCLSACDAATQTPYPLWSCDEGLTCCVAKVT